MAMARSTYSFHSVLKGNYPGWDAYGSGQTEEVEYDSRTILGYRGPRRSSGVNSCVHTISSWRPVHQNQICDQDPGSDYRDLYMNVYDAGRQAGVSSAIPVLSPSDFDAVMQDLVGEIQTDVLLPNLVLELPEALTLHTQLKSAFSKRPKTWNDAGLAYTFGLAPLARDLVALAKLGNRVRRRVSYLSKVSSNDFVPWNKKIPVDKGSLEPTLTGGFPSLELTGVLVNPEYRDITLTATASLFARRIRTRTVDPRAETALGYLDASGMTKAGSVLWEAIPFSFVADWFHPFGRALNVLNTSAFQGCMAFTNSGWQSRVSCTFTRYAQLNCGYARTSKKFLIGAGNVSTYRRAPGFPNTAPSSNFGVRQSILSGMLAFQKI